ncbi:MAG: L,D-transpeptidase [Myxococcales bacterium]|nr:L,D-transpeptidase [Myxococcales bacterium]
MPWLLLAATAACGPATQHHAATAVDAAAPGLAAAALDQVAGAAPAVGEAAPSQAKEGAGAKGTWAPGDPDLVKYHPEPLSYMDGLPRIGAIGPHVWIKPKPSGEGLALGKLRIGTAVKLRGSGPVRGEGCKRGWYPVEPRGYVCLNDRTTLELSDPYFRALAEVSPRPDTVWPYSYAHSRGAPMYSRVPTPDEWQNAERHLGPPGTYKDLGPWAEGHEELIEADRKIEATDAVPWFFEGGVRRVSGGNYDPRRLTWKSIPNGSMLAYARAFEMHGRVWLVTPDLMIVPADRVQYMRRSVFHGVVIGEDGALGQDGGMSLPLAWNRAKTERPLFERGTDGRFVESREQMKPKQALEIEDARVVDGKEGYFPLRKRPGLFVKESFMTFTRQRTKLPGSIKPDQKWVEAKILPGTLTAYVGLQPVYATLFSPGKGGLPIKGHNMSKDATTEIGHFPVEWKERVATMSNEKGDPKVLWFSDVPHQQYLHAPLAMHVAFWHEDFSNPKSAECVNVSALDGRWLFGFTDPVLPPDWNAIRPGGGNGPSTPIVTEAR